MDKEIRPEDLSLYYNEMLRSNLTELELETPKGKIILKRACPEKAHPHPGSAASQFRRRKSDLSHADAGPVPAPEGVKTVNSPITGVFYRSSSPQSAPFVKDGDVVNAGSTLCIIEAMKVMNEIKAEYRCRIVQILVENSKPITKNQPLFQVEPQ